MQWQSKWHFNSQAYRDDESFTLDRFREDPNNVVSALEELTDFMKNSFNRNSDHEYHGYFID